MKSKVPLDKDNTEISIKDQIKRLVINNMYGFQTVILYGLGRRLEIFDYLYNKGKSLSDKDEVSIISFTPKELSEKLNLDEKYLDAWLHMALECSIFEIDDPVKKTLKTGPHIYDLLINQDHTFYIGNTISIFYYMAPYSELIYNNFKTGKIENIFDFPEEIIKDAHRIGARQANLTEQLFSKQYKEFKKRLQKDGIILDVGCGYGFSLEYWAKKYKKARFIAIDIDPKAVAFTKELVERNGWSNRIRIFNISIEDFAHTSDVKFDLILLNDTLHEMDPDEEYRRNALEDLYLLLKFDGILLVRESMISDMFTPKKEFQLFDIMHKWLEVVFGSRFYNEESFRKLINSTSFKSAEFVKKGGEYFWAVKKETPEPHLLV